MNLRRIFANAIARRVAYVVVAIVLAWLGLGDARAQVQWDFSQCNTTGNSVVLACPTRAQAYAASKHAAEFNGSNIVTPTSPGWINYQCNSSTGVCQVTYNYVGLNSSGQQRTSNASRSWPQGQDCPNPAEQWDPLTNSCNTPCQDLSPLPQNGTNAPGQSDSVCVDGCAYECSGFSLYVTIDGQLRTVCGSAWTSRAALCSAADPAPLPPVVDTDGDGTSDANDGNPNNPGSNGTNQGQDESRACGGQGQPECAEDGSNAGSGNGNTSGGGGNCQTPPVSSGDAILAQIAFQTWATRCALEGNANEGRGTGDGPGQGDGEQPDWTKGEGPAAPTDDTDYIGDQTRWELPVSTDLIDQENIFGGGSCEHFSIPIWRGVTVSTADFEGWCTLQQILRGLILIFGAFSAIQILLGRW